MQIFDRQDRMLMMLSDAKYKNSLMPLCPPHYYPIEILPLMVYIKKEVTTSPIFQPSSPAVTT